MCTMELLTIHRYFMPKCFVLSLKYWYLLLPSFSLNLSTISFQHLLPFLRFSANIFSQLQLSPSSRSLICFFKLLSVFGPPSLLSTGPSLAQSLGNQVKRMMSNAMLAFISSSRGMEAQIEWVLPRCTGVQKMQLALCFVRCTATPSPTISAMTSSPCPQLQSCRR